jgi:hypothetical protein
MAKKKLSAAIVSVGVWTAALASAAVHTYEFHRTPHFVATAPQSAATLNAAPALLVRPVSEPQPLLSVPSITIVARSNRPSHRPSAASPPKATTGVFGGMTCTSWRELDMGSGRVRVCE